MLNKWEVFFLIVIAMAVMGHVVITPLMLDIGGRDGWMSIFLSLPFALLFAFVIYRLRLKHPDKDFLALSTYLLGKGGGLFLLVVLLIYFLFLTAFSIALLIDFTYIAFLPETPEYALLIWFVIFFGYAAWKGIKAIALTAGVLTVIAMFAGHMITLLDTRLKDWGEMRPFLEFGVEPVLWGMLLLISIWVELLFLFFLPVKDLKEKRMFLFWSAGIFLNALFMFSTFTGTITIFGLGQAGNFLYPALESVRIISLGFIDRFDVYGLLLMCIGIYIRCSLYFRIAYDQMTTSIPIKWVKYIVFFICLILVSVVAYYFTADHFRLAQVLNYYAYTVILFPIPFVLWFISFFKPAKK